MKPVAKALFDAFKNNELKNIRIEKSVLSSRFIIIGETEDKKYITFFDNLFEK